MSLCRQNYNEEREAGINKQINLELHASYVYMSMVQVQNAFFDLSFFFLHGVDVMRSVLVLKAYHFDRDDVALPGFHQFMLKQSDEERGHAQKVSLLRAIVRKFRTRVGQAGSPIWLKFCM